MEGNQMKMRETLVSLQARFERNVMAYQDRYFKFSGWHWNKKAKEAAKWRDIFSELNEQCKDAISAPPRNCDVGTHEEQWSRFEKMCFSNRQPDDPDYCSCKCKVDGGCVNDCALKWAQMPYEAEEGGKGDGV